MRDCNLEFAVNLLVVGIRAVSLSFELLIVRASLSEGFAIIDICPLLPNLFYLFFEEDSRF